ncbi:MAG: PQQ-binding-like beta-propeller repeat protein [bacterium]|nr:PQQ-binding-like beta-propeller repeat protein [bacterium]
MKRFWVRPTCCLAALLLCAPTARSDDWTTVGADAQRSSWVRADTKISAATVRAPEFQFLWKKKLDNASRGENALTAPALLDFLISHRGFRSLAFIGGSGGGVFAIDTDLARMEWERRLDSGSSQTSSACPGGMTANVTRPTAAALPSLLGFGARGRRAPGKSGVGRPGGGAVTLANVSSPVRAPRPAPVNNRERPPAQRSLRGISLVYVLSADGLLHSLYVSNGHDHDSPLPFLPANANARGLIVVDDVAYVATSNGCGDATDGVWALDLKTRKVTSWKSSGGAVAGAAGVAIGPDGTIYAATSNGALVALEARTLRQKSASTASGFRSSPVVLDYKGTDYVAAVARNGALQLFGAKNFKEAVATTPASLNGDITDAALATWRDSGGVSWILVPAADSIVAWKIVESQGAVRLEKGWASPKMASPLPPTVVNGVVFAAAGGNRSTRAKLFALDGATGRRLWDSRETIESYARGNVLSSGPGHVYLTTQDSTIYAFGFPMEH